MQGDASSSSALVVVPPRINHVLIDHENVQPAALSLLDRSDVRIWIFVGASQTKLSADLAMAAHAMGSRVRYVRISGNGSNALDFHMPITWASWPASNRMRSSTSFPATPVLIRY